jgi:hypothetical protein
MAMSVLRNGAASPTSERTQLWKDTVAGRRPPGLSCPRCGERILVDIASLLGKFAVTCARCGLVLTMNWEDDERARRALRQVADASSALERTRAFRGP